MSIKTLSLKFIELETDSKNHRRFGLLEEGKITYHVEVIKELCKDIEQLKQQLIFLYKQNMTTNIALVLKGEHEYYG